MKTRVSRKYPEILKSHSNVCLHSILEPTITTNLRYFNGITEPKYITCGEQIISVVSTRMLSPSSHTNTTLSVPFDCQTDSVCFELQRNMNFKHYFNETINLPSLGQQSGEITVEYVCMNVSSGKNHKVPYR